MRVLLFLDSLFKWIAIVNIVFICIFINMHDQKYFKYPLFCFIINHALWFITVMIICFIERDKKELR